MPNIYVFWSGSGDPPSPWVKITTYDGRYVRCDSNTGNALGTGGSSSHTHSASGSTSYAKRSASSYNSTYGISGHSHTVSNVSVSTADNIPPYYTLSLIRMDLDTWRSIRSFPQGTVVVSYSSINTGVYTDWELFTSANGYLIKLGSPGSAGGSSEHNHSVSGSLSGGSSYLSDGGAGVSIAGGGSHTHTYSGNSDNGTLLPYSIYTRFYRAKNDVIYTPVNIVCFFDGTPTSEWTVITGWDGAILGAGDTNPTTSGSDTHTHTYSGTSSSYGSALSSKTGSSSFVPPSHTHTVDITLESASHVPPYVNLIPAYLNTEQSAWNTRTSTYSVDALINKSFNKQIDDDVVIKKTFDNNSLNLNPSIKVICDSVYDNDSLILKTISHSLSSINALVNKALDVNVSNDTLLSKGFSTSLPLNILTEATKNFTYSDNALLQKARIYETASNILLSRAFDLVYALDSLVQKSYDSSYDSTARIWTRPPLSISGSELTISEGDIYIEFLLRTAYGVDWVLVRRKYLDYFTDLFLLRLDIDVSHDSDVLVQSMFDEAIEMCSTIKRIGEISHDIDILINRLDIDIDIQSSVLVTKAFDISGGINTYLLREYDTSATIGTRIWTRPPFMLSGWTLYTSAGDLALRQVLRREYEIDWQLVHRKYISKYINSLIRRDDIDILHELESILQKAFDADYDTNLYSQIAFDRSYDGSSMLLKEFDRPLESDSLLEKLGIDAAYDNDLIAEKTFISTYDNDVQVNKEFDQHLEFDGLIKRLDINLEYDIAPALEKAFDLWYDNNALISNIFDKYAEFDGLIKIIQDISSSINALLIRYDIISSFDARTSLKCICTIPYTSSTTIQTSFEFPLAIGTRIWTREPFRFVGDVLQVSGGDIYLEQLLRVIYESDLQLALRRHSPVVLDVLVNRLGIDISHDSDVLIQRSFVDEYDIDVLVQREFDRLAELYTTVKRIFDRVLNIGSLINKLDIDVDVLANIHLSKAFDNSFVANGELIKSFDIVYILRTFIERKSIPETYDLMTSIKLISDASYGIKSIQRISFDLSELSNTTLKVINDISTDLDLLLNRLGIDAEYDSDVLLECAFQSDFDIDLMMIKTFDANSLFNAAVKRIQSVLLAANMILERLGICVEYIYGVYLQKGFECGYDSHLYAIKTFEHDIDLDSLVERRDNECSGYLDSLVETTFDVEGSIDLMLQISFELSRLIQTSLKVILDVAYDIETYVEIRDVPIDYESGGTLKLISDRSFDVNVLIEKMFDINTRIDTTIKRIQSVWSNLDMLLIRKDIPVDVVNNMLLQKKFDVSNTMLSTIKAIREIYTDICTSIKVIQEISYGLDIIVERAYDRLIESDMLLRRDSIDIEYNADLLLELTQSLSYAKSVIMRKDFDISYPFDTMFDKTFDVQYNSASYILRGYQWYIMHNMLLSNVFDSNYYNILRLKKYALIANGKSRFQTRIEPRRSKAFTVVDVFSRLVRDNSIESDGMWP